ncbi:MAG: hypothetical protein FLDDKLPJ_00430 [Phycisphaerae bacterium]|nr:hypothetical protein [Phycisphaerae bacterium]
MRLAATVIAWALPVYAGAESAAIRTGSSGSPDGVRVVVYPSAVRLEHAADVQRIVVVAEHPDGRTVDVSAMSGMRIEPPGLARIVTDPAGVEAPRIEPVSDGEGTLHIEGAGQTVALPIRVSHATMRPRTSFRNDVLPVFMKAGCNTGGCHGSAEGKEGFRLSLFGFEPEKDYVSLTRDMSTRRIELAHPRASLLLRKPLGEAEHGGGQRLASEGELSATIQRWIEERAPDDLADTPTLTGVELLPSRCVLVGTGVPQQLIVRATYSDGTDRDVTSLAVYDSSDPLSATVSAQGRVLSGQKGEAYVMARFGSFAVVTQLLVLGEGSGYAWTVPPTSHPVDEAIYAKLRTMQVLPSGPASDETFVRRAYLDVLGVLPSVEETTTFLADPSPTKRADLIDRLLTRPEFVDVWAMKWAELLRIESGSKRLSFKAMHSYNDWLREALRDNVPIDRLVRELLTAEGGNFSNPATNFHLVETSPTLMAEHVAQVFAGIRIQCAQCHNHPFERWTQDDYYGFAAFFAQVGRKSPDDPRETVVYNTGGGEVAHARTGQAMRPRFLGGQTPEVAGRDRRAALAEWLTAPDNPYFASSFVDRVWAHFFGRGLVDPPDDVRVSNPPSHPQLRADLARRFVESGYDLRGLVRLICTSATYQASSEANATNAADERNFSHAAVRRLPAEVLLDAVCQVTQVPEKFAGLPSGSRATQVADAQSGSFFLSVFGRPARLSACTCERRDEPTLSQALHLINGATLTSKLSDPGGKVAQHAAAGTPFDAVLDEAYLSALCRRPTDTERAALRSAYDAAPDKRQALEDLYWAILNSTEFIFNH